MLQLPLRRLGRTGFQVSALSLGGVGIGGFYGPLPERDAVATAHRALERGINYIDTSPLYNDSERRLGIALQGVPRDHYYLSTKTGTHPERRGDYSWDGARWSVENSLRLLKTSYVDLLLVHDPIDMAPVLAPRGALVALESLKEQGVIRAIGLGVREHHFHRQAIESGRFDAILTYRDYQPLRTTAADWLLPLAAHHDVGVINGSPFVQGLLCDEDPDVVAPRLRVKASQQELAGARRLYRFCRDRSIPVPALVIQFCLRQPLIATTLTGAKTPAELDQNLDGVEFPIPESAWSELAALDLAMP